MNELQVFQSTEFGSVKEIEKANKNNYIGFFYLLEWGDLVKIGCSKKPYQRLLALKRIAQQYAGLQIGRFAISQGHTNYEENEKVLHSHFKAYRKSDTELFEIDLDETIKDIPDNLILKDETSEKESKADAFLNGMKSFMLGGFANE